MARKLDSEWIVKFTVQMDCLVVGQNLYFLKKKKKKNETLTNLLLQLDDLFELIFYEQGQLHLYCIGEFYYALIALFGIIKKVMSHVIIVSTLVP